MKHQQRERPKEPPESNLIHFLCTRFNTPHNESLNLDPTWLVDRLELFASLCVPSVVAQNCRNFDWLVFADIETPRGVLDLLYKVCMTARARLILLTGKFTADELKRGISMAYMDDKSLFRDWIITTKLDADDQIHPDFIGKVQQTMAGRGPEATTLNLLEGYELRDEEIYHLSRPGNEFASYCERWMMPGELHTVHGFPIEQADDYGTVINQKGSKLWCKTSHRTNALNKSPLSTVKVRETGAVFPKVIRMPQETIAP